MATFLDIVKANNADKEVGVIEEALRLHPEINLADTREIPGIHYETLVRTALGNTGGSFRVGNRGITPPAHTYENRRVECFLAEPRFTSDKAIADSYVDGAAAYIAMDVSGTMEGEMQALSSQFYYGASAGQGFSLGAVGNALGFPGLIDAYDSVNRVINAGGTTANTGSSVWLVRFGPQMIRWVLGNGGRMQWGPVRIESILDPTDATYQKRFDGYVQTMVYRPGLQIGSLWSAVRVKEITADSGCTLTDAMIYNALSLFPAGTQPDVILMSRRSLYQLRASRTTYNPLGVPPPIPTHIAGLAGLNIPIQVTDGISNNEPLTL